MAGKRVWVHDVTEEMILAEDVLSREGLLLVGKGTVITSKIMVKLKFYAVPYVYVEEHIELHQKKPSYFKRIESSKEFAQFSTTLHVSVDKLKKSINHAITYSEELDTEELLMNVHDIVTNAGNGLHLMSMLQCIRSYDDLTYLHGLNVALICNVIADWMHMGEEDKIVLTTAGMLHDIGKTVIPREILTKPSGLTEEEYQMMQSHATKGYQLVRGQRLDSRVKMAILQHHERCDGSGYPFGLASDNISEFAKIIAIADVYDAMTSFRVYRQGICPFDVIDTFEKEGYQKYDPAYLLPFLERVTQCYIHANVELSNGKEGEVIMLNRHCLGKPVVKVENDYINLAETGELYIKSLL